MVLVRETSDNWGCWCWAGLGWAGLGWAGLGWAGAICYAAWLSPPRIQQLFDTNILSDAKYRALDSGDQVAHFSRRNLIQTSFLEHVFGTNSLCDEQEVAGGTSTSSGGHSHVKLERVGCLVLLHLEPVTLQHEVIIPHFYQGLNLHTNKEGFYM